MTLASRHSNNQAFDLGGNAPKGERELTAGRERAVDASGRWPIATGALGRHGSWRRAGREGRRMRWRVWKVGSHTPSVLAQRQARFRTSPGKLVEQRFG